MSVYDPLQTFLKKRSGSHWKAKFADLEQILQRPLPKSAYRYQAWWANQEGQGHSQTAAWKSAGWRTSNLDLAGQTVEFEKTSGDRKDQWGAAKPSSSDMASSDLRDRAAAYLGTQEEAVIYREGLKALVEREAARRLIRLGGTMPDLEVTPRRRTDEG